MSYGDGEASYDRAMGLIRKAQELEATPTKPEMGGDPQAFEETGQKRGFEWIPGGHDSQGGSCPLWRALGLGKGPGRGKGGGFGAGKI